MLLELLVVVHWYLHSQYPDDSTSPPHPNKKIAPVAAAGVEDRSVSLWLRLLGCFACSPALLCRLQVLKIWNITLSTVKL